MINYENESIEKFINLQNLLANISDDLFYSDNMEFDEKINRGLKVLGEYTNADRVYIFEYNFEKNQCSNTYEWCNDAIIPFIDELQNVPLDDIPHWVNSHL